MQTILHHPSFDAYNQTSIDSTNDDVLHLFILTAVWIVLIITIIFGTTGNILVLYIYVYRKDNKTCTFFIKMLAVVDLTICLVLAPLELYQTTTGIRNEFLCKCYGFLNTHVLYSTLLITTIAFDRYFCICWPLYKIITIHRARLIVFICGLLSTLLAIIPMGEYSTIEHVLHIHNNHSEQLSIETYDEYESSGYTYVENIKTILPFTIGNITHVKCSPRFSLHLHLSKFLFAYRTFHGTLFATCIILVLILYLFIYNAIYQRRRTRTKRFSTYRKILHSYLINNEEKHKQIRRNSFVNHFCCHKTHKKTSRKTTLHQSLNNQQKQNYSQHEQSSAIKQKPQQIILEVNGARGKRFSAISMTSMTYVTSGVWEDALPTNLIRSRVNSIPAVTYCGIEQAPGSRTSTEDSFDQTNKLPIVNHTFATHLTVPGQCSNEVTIKDNQLNEIELSENVSPCNNLLHPLNMRKPSNTLSIRQIQRSSELSLQQRKVSFLTSGGLAERCIIEDPSDRNQQLTVHINDHQSLSTSSSIDPAGSLSRNSITSTRRTSAFDTDAQRIFERQQRQERLANIRTTLTLSIVTATFILMYLPSVVITLFNIKPYEFREVLFLLYYVNSACNPLIYSFFNVNFRNDIRRIYECQKREYLARQY